jgi:hypothetical protein
MIANVSIIFANIYNIFRRGEDKMKWKFLVTIIIITLLSLTYLIVNNYLIEKSENPIDNEPGESENPIDNEPSGLEISISWSDKSNIKNWTFASDWIIATITNNLNSSQYILVEWNGNLVYDLNLITPMGTIYKEKYPKANEFDNITLKQGENASFNLYDLPNSNSYSPEHFSEIGRYRVWITVNNHESNRIVFDLYPDFDQDSTEYYINIMFTSSLSANITYKFDDGSDEIIQLPNNMNVGHKYIYYNHTIKGQYHTLYLKNLDTGYEEQLSFCIFSDGYYIPISVESPDFSKDQFHISFLDDKPMIA